MFHVPANEVKRKKWTDSCGVLLTQSSRICALHFESFDFVSSSDCKRVRLSDDALPLAVESLCDWKETSSKFANVATQTE